MANFRQLPRIVLIMALSLSGYASAEPASPADVPSEEQAHATEGHHGHKGQCDRHKGAAEKPDHLLPNCARSKSVHNYVSYVPIVGPFFDLSTIDSNVQLKWWEVPLSVVLPVFGPGITRTLGTRTCVDDMPHGHCQHGHDGHGGHEKACEAMKHEHSL